MNAPHFNTKNLPSSWGSSAWMQAVITEEKRCCDGIDKRHEQLHAEFTALHAQLNEAEKQMKVERGLFARIGLHFKMKRLRREMAWRQHGLIELCDAKAARMYV